MNINDEDYCILRAIAAMPYGHHKSITIPLSKIIEKMLKDFYGEIYSLVADPSCWELSDDIRNKKLNKIFSSWAKKIIIVACKSLEEEE
jgi:hypothetical protein